jgi:hypothetical protein
MARSSALSPFDGCGSAGGGCDPSLASPVAGGVVGETGDAGGDGGAFWAELLARVLAVGEAAGAGAGPDLALSSACEADTAGVGGVVQLAGAQLGASQENGVLGEGGR